LPSLFRTAGIPAGAFAVAVAVDSAVAIAFVFRIAGFQPAPLTLLCRPVAPPHLKSEISKFQIPLTPFLPYHSPSNTNRGPPMSLYMIIEHFKNNDPAPIYRRFRDHGRMAPEGLNYVSSWVDESLTRCYQLMETSNRSLVDQWITAWSDLIDFEVHPVITSAEATEKIAPQL
jgi:hypothetical protein